LNQVGKAVEEVSNLLSANTVGTTYALLGVRGVNTSRHNPIKIEAIGGLVTTADSGVFRLLLNPTLSAPLSYSPAGDYAVALATNQTVVASGRLIDALPINSSGSSVGATENVLQWLSFAIDGTPDEFVLAYSPVTTNQSVAGTLPLVEYLWLD
jgi:hypothetical protein